MKKKFNNNNNNKQINKNKRREGVRGAPPIWEVFRLPS